MINIERRKGEYNFRGKVRTDHGAGDWLTMLMGWGIVAFIVAATGIMVAAVVL